MFNAARSARMKRGSYCVSISRGVCAVTEDIVEALRSGRLAGVGLDVVDPEPLPADHPLWTLPGVLLTPHVAIAGSGSGSTTSRPTPASRPERSASTMSSVTAQTPRLMLTK